MTDHILNAELCAKCPAKKICQAIVPDGEWNPYIGKNPCPAILQKPEDQQIVEWERQEEQHEFNEACRVAQYNLWVCDDGAP